MKVERWSSACRERSADEPVKLLPAEVRYMLQWQEDCENFGACQGSDAYLRKLKKKYVKNPVVMDALDGKATSKKP